jgi:hypothetical protein
MPLHCGFIELLGADGREWTCFRLQTPIAGRVAKVAKSLDIALPMCVLISANELIE